MNGDNFSPLHNLAFIIFVCQKKEMKAKNLIWRRNQFIRHRHVIMRELAKNTSYSERSDEPRLHGITGKANNRPKAKPVRKGDFLH